MSGDSKQTTTTSAASPWEPSQDLLKLGLKDASNIYKSGTAFQPFTGSTVTPFSNQTMQGMNAIESGANNAMTSGTGMDKAYDFYSNMFNDGGLSDEQRSIADMWGKTASGSELSDVNPYFNDLLSKMESDVGTRANLAMSGAGRYGSGEHTDVLANSVGNVAKSMLGDEWARQLGRMDSARTNLANLGQQGVQNRFGAGEALPGAYEATKAPAKDLMSIGSMYEDLMSRSMADRVRIFDETRNAPLSAIQWINSIGSGAGQLGGNRTSTQSSPAPNPFLQAAGIGLGFNNLMNNPLGSLFGG